MENNSMLYNNSQKNQYVVDQSFKYENKNNNGRIQLKTSQNGTPFFIQDLIPKNEKTNYFNATPTYDESNIIIKYFFLKKILKLFKMQFALKYIRKQNKNIL